MNVPVQVSVKTYVFIFLIMYIAELLDHMVTLCLTFWWTIKLFYKVAVPLYISIRIKLKRLAMPIVGKDLEELELTHC